MKTQGNNSTATHRNDATYGWLLVGAQLALLAALALAAISAPLPSTVKVTCCGLLMLAGLGLFAYTLTFNRLGNWSVHPAPYAHGTLITTGPYRFIRHPMYGAALLCAAATVVWHTSGQTVLLMAALFIVLFAKISVEERLMSQTHPGWEQYQARSKRLIPLLW